MIEAEPRDDAKRDTHPEMGQADVLEALSRKQDLPVKKIELYPPQQQEQAVEAARSRVKEAADRPRTYDDPGYANLMRNAAAAGPVENDRMATADEIRAAGVAPRGPEVGGVTRTTPVAGPQFDVEQGPRHGGGKKGVLSRVRSGFRRMFGRSQPKH